MRLASVLTAFAIACLSSAYASPPEVTQSLPRSEQVGEARYRVLTLAVFDAALWANDGDFSWEQPFALTLTYRRAFTAAALTDRTIDEMSRRGASASTLSSLRTRLQACFANVTPGDRITGVSTGAGAARFYLNGRQRCDIEAPGFRRQFFGIWLDSRSGDRAFTARLLGAG